MRVMNWGDLKAIHCMYLKFKYLPAKEDQIINLVHFTIYCDAHKLDDQKIIKFVRDHKCGKNWL